MIGEQLDHVADTVGVQSPEYSPCDSMISSIWHVPSSFQADACADAPNTFLSISGQGFQQSHSCDSVFVSLVDDFDCRMIDVERRFQLLVDCGDECIRSSSVIVGSATYTAATEI